MKRRQFITLLGGAAAVWPLAVRAQQAGKVPTIGFLGTSTASIQSQWVAAFVQRLRELGWIDGRTIAIEVRWAEARQERSPRSQPNSSGSKSMLSSRQESQPSRQSR
jgi:putative ABC transport system substrate-binding protein